LRIRSLGLSDGPQSLLWVIGVKCYVSAAWAVAIGFSASVGFSLTMTMEIHMAAYVDPRLGMLAVLRRAFNGQRPRQRKQVDIGNPHRVP
jgi:hypothetical protein